MSNDDFLPPRPIEAGILAGLPASFRVEHSEHAGVRLRILTGGEGHPVVLLHGRGAAASVWFPLVATLARNNRVVAIDLPGFGSSSQPRFSAGASTFDDGIAAFVAPVEAFLAEQKLIGATVIGHSLGGLSALELALRGAAKPSKLVLIASMGLDPRMSTGSRLFFRAGPERLARWLGKSLFNRISSFPDTVTGRKLADLMFELYSVPGGRDAATAAFNCLFPMRGPAPNRGDRLGEIDTPVHLVWGEADEVLPAAIPKDVAPRFRRAEVHLVPFGHSPHLEASEQVTPLLAELSASV